MTRLAAIASRNKAIRRRRPRCLIPLALKCASHWRSARILDLKLILRGNGSGSFAASTIRKRTVL